MEPVLAVFIVACVLLFLLIPNVVWKILGWVIADYVLGWIAWICLMLLLM